MSSRGGNHHTIENLEGNREKSNTKENETKEKLRNDAKKEKQMTKKERWAARKKAYKIWATTEGKATYIRLANETGLSVDQLKYYKEKDKWKLRYNKDKENKTITKIAKEQAKGIENENFKEKVNEDIDQINEIFDKYKLTERERLFVMHYLRTFNITQSAKSAGYAPTSAHSKGAVIMKRKHIQNSLNEVRALVSKDILIDAYDIISEYIKIAFADMTEYVTFNKDKVELKESDQIDGRLITEVKQGKDGVTIKLADKMKALEKLEKLFEVLPDKRLELDTKKFELQKRLADKANEEGSNITIINDIS